MCDAYSQPNRTAPMHFVAAKSNGNSGPADGGTFPFPGKPCARRGSGDPLKGLNPGKAGKSCDF